MPSKALPRNGFVNELIEYLYAQRESRTAIADLPRRLRDAGILSTASRDELIEIGKRKHCRIGPEHELQLEGGWEFEVYKERPGFLSWPEMLERARTETYEHDDIRPHLQLSTAGKNHAAELLTSRRAENTTGEIPTFRDLLNEFDAGQRIEDRDEFFLIVVSPEQWEKNRAVFQVLLEPIGTISVKDNADGYLVLAPRVEVRCGQFGEHNDERPMKKFIELARRAGEALPPSVRKSWSVQPNNPVDTWLTAMWLEHRPKLGKLTIYSVVSGKSKASPSWERPFSISAEIVRQYGFVGQSPSNLSAIEPMPNAQTNTTRAASHQTVDGMLSFAEAAREFDVPPAEWTRASKKKRGEVDYLPHEKRGRFRFVIRENAEAFSKNYHAKREQRVVGSKSRDGATIVSDLLKNAKHKKPR